MKNNKNKKTTGTIKGQDLFKNCFVVKEVELILDNNHNQSDEELATDIEDIHELKRSTGKALDAFRDERGLSVTQFVNLIDSNGKFEGSFSEKNYYNLINGKYGNLSPELLIALKKSGVDLDKIFSQTNKNN